MDQRYLAQAVSVGCNLYETIRLLARSGEISSDANNTYFGDSRLGFQPYHRNEESNEDLKRLVIALGLRTVEFLFQAGIVTLYGNLAKECSFKTQPEATNSGLADAVRILKALGTDFTKGETDGETALHKGSSGEMTELLLEYGCKVEALDADLNTLLQKACGWGQEGVGPGTILMTTGAASVVNGCTKFGKTA